MKDFPIQQSDPLSILAISKGCTTWHMVIHYIKNLPYGRNANREDLSLVLQEMQGTCSSKHALLKELADLNQIPAVYLVMAIYKMNDINTPGIGDVISQNNLPYIPEAHCYLEIENQSFDCTNAESDLSRIQNDILTTQRILPYQVNSYKVKCHQEFIRNWIQEQQMDHSFEDIWSWREECIRNLSN